MQHIIKRTFQCYKNAFIVYKIDINDFFFYFISINKLKFMN